MGGGKEGEKMARKVERLQARREVRVRARGERGGKGNLTERTLRAAKGRRHVSSMRNGVYS